MSFVLLFLFQSSMDDRIGNLEMTVQFSKIQHSFVFVLSLLLCKEEGEKMAMLCYLLCSAMMVLLYISGQWHCMGYFLFLFLVIIARHIFLLRT